MYLSLFTQELILYRTLQKQKEKKMYMQRGGCFQQIGLFALIMICIGITFIVMVSPGGSNFNPNVRPEYSAKLGECFVPPQGDPLWDQHYAEHVNPGNCKAFKDQKVAQIPDKVSGVFTKVLLSIVAVIVIVSIVFISFAKRGVT